MIPLYVCTGIACFAVLRIVIERYSLRKLPYLNVLSFAVAGTLVLLVPHPLAIIAAAAYFVGSTLESNAIASTYAGGMRRDD